ncbi:hypothetical protein GQ42DRAFT_89924 [Ramicandelaber brevisporus]|nr:hypothetical protein GQ42DRAFT_89924 [Ramicandelaber brevisporus]
MATVPFVSCHSLSQHTIKLHILTFSHTNIHTNSRTHTHTFSLSISLFLSFIKPNQTTQPMQPRTARVGITIAVLSSAAALTVHAILHGYIDSVLRRMSGDYLPFKLVFPHIAAAYSVLFGIYALYKTRATTHTIVPHDVGFIEKGQPDQNSPVQVTVPRFGLTLCISLFATACWIAATVAFFFDGVPLEMDVSCSSLAGGDNDGEIICHMFKAETILFPATTAFWLIASILCFLARSSLKAASSYFN